MRAYIKMISLVIALTSASCLLPQKASAQVVSYQVFYDQLAPYGQWVSYPDYGYVWVPRVSAGFYPYGTNGYWVYTDEGWTWYSNYPWGWAPFHYGRWDNDPNYGWFWIPDTQWGPAWVTWLDYPGYYGWEPLGVRASYDDFHRCRFVKNEYFGRRDINNYYVINNNYYRGAKRGNGPNVDEIRRVSGRNINPVIIGERARPGQAMNNGKYEIYRPRVEKNGDAKPNPANYGGTRPAPIIQQHGNSSSSPNPANYGGTRPGGPNSGNTNSGTRTSTPKSAPNPRNYGGAAPGGPNQPVKNNTPKSSPNPANYGGTRPAPITREPAPVNTKQAPVRRESPPPVIREPAPQRAPQPANYGGARPSAPAPQRAPNPANYGGEKPRGPK